MKYYLTQAGVNLLIESKRKGQQAQSRRFVAKQAAARAKKSPFLDAVQKQLDKEGYGTGSKQKTGTIDVFGNPKHRESATHLGKIHRSGEDCVGSTCADLRREFATTAAKDTPGEEYRKQAGKELDPDLVKAHLAGKMRDQSSSEAGN